MKKLILKGLGKAKVKKILKLFLIDTFNDHLERNINLEKNTVFYGNEVFEFPLYCTVRNDMGETYGLPDLGEDDDFQVQDLVEFVGGKI